MSEPEIVVCQDILELYQRAATRFVTLASRACQSAGQFTVALSGGSTPRGLYSLLSTAGYRGKILWSHVHLFWGDERCVAPDHQDSNYRMVEESLLAWIDIDKKNIHRMAGEKEPQAAAREYEEMLKEFFSLSSGQFPRFDLVLLGLGEDGHTASLFPSSDALDELHRIAVAPFVEHLGAHRLTLTLPVLNRAAEVIFLVAGKEKAKIVKTLFQNEAGAAPLPACRIMPENGKLTWLIEQSAGALLSGQVWSCGDDDTKKA